MTFDDDDCYKLFLIADDLARIRNGEDEMVNELRMKLLPVYKAWHTANPCKVHPTALRSRA
jgi:hypothetical protein